MGNLEVIHTGASILYFWDILGSSIYIVDKLRIDDLRIDDQSSILRSSIYNWEKSNLFNHVFAQIYANTLQGGGGGGAYMPPVHIGLKWL